MTTTKELWIEAGPRARVLAGREPWLEGEALRQLAQAAELPGCEAAVGLPDLHPGPGIPIGATLALRGVVRPALVGSDAGCGARVTAIGRVKHSADALVRRALDATDAPVLPGIGPRALLDAAWARGPAGLAGLAGVPEALAELAALEPEEEGPPAGPAPEDESLAADLGTIGGGNHFLELSRIVDVRDRETASRLGLERGGHAVVAHSGSRRFGFELAEGWSGRALEPGPERDEYLRLHSGALRLARTNRFLLSWRMLQAAGAARSGRVRGSFDVTHNAVTRPPREDADLWLHRKGSAPAEQGQATVVLATRGDASWVLRGGGCADSLWSVAHGAGRRWSRAEAVRQVRSRYRRHQLARTPSGGRVVCDDVELLQSEHPDAYKPVEPVVQALEEAGAAQRVAALLPLVTVKR